MDDWHNFANIVGFTVHIFINRQIKPDTGTMINYKKAQVEPGKFLLWAIFVLAAGAVILYLIFNWSSIIDKISFFS